MSCPDRLDAAGMRGAYLAEHQTFLESHLESKDPIVQFTAWFKLACNDPEIGQLANAMTLATATRDGLPSARIVLLKGFDKDGFAFYTNQDSRKGQELLSNPQASLVFHWKPLNRQITIEGSVEKLSDEVSTEYFHSRPRDSQIGTCVSHQSTVVESRDILTQRYTELKERYADPNTIIPKPDYWGGFLLKPKTMEFWQGQTNRLHDRIVFRQPTDGEVIDEKLTHTGDDGWVYERMSP
ncbi:pyridoxine/pyridoxamine 5'-phosphate oxidase-like [Glandiceps talaboti]